MKKSFYLSVILFLFMFNQSFAEKILPMTEVASKGLILEDFAFNGNLSDVFQNKFVGLFDKVDGVWVTSDDNCNYYYLVEGTLNGEFSYEYFKITEQDAIDHSYTYLDTESEEFASATEYCKDYSIFPGCPVTSCDIGYACKGPICGTWDPTFGVCQIY